jgi:hypothetical protein
MERIAETINRAHAETSGVTVVLENVAGQVLHECHEQHETDVSMESNESRALTYSDSIPAWPAARDRVAF